MKERIKIRRCKYACPFSIYPGCSVRSNAATNVEDSGEDKCSKDSWTKNGGTSLVGKEWVYNHTTAGCTLKVMNDGKQLPIEYIEGLRDITCVGPDSDWCPKKLGFHFEETTEPDRSKRDVARLRHSHPSNL